MKLKIKRLHPAARLPRYESPGAAAIDLRAVLEETPTAWVSRGAPRTFRTGLAVEVPEGHVLLIFSRSGHGFGHGLRLANCVGVIDSDYRGEVAVKLTMDDAGGYEVIDGERIAQAVLVAIPRLEIEEVDELTVTERGASGFGSTGKE